MALEHLLPGHTQALVPEGPLPPEFESRALFKGQDLEVIQLLMPEGRRMLEHRVDGEITLQCLKGCVDVISHALDSADPRPKARLTEGELLYLQRGEPHQLLAVVSSVVLLTIALSGN
jgi:quercetin dioxygenase-like cupin family protein